MSQEEIEERFQKNIGILKALEKILKGLDQPYDVHTARMNWLQHLLDSVSDLKTMELEADKVARIREANLPLPMTDL